ncbi:2027_t:CDS:2 [Cetraspora pellucida]|uniref:2027_t:CDS:1 n=1 Tax=Cetraspora pellucida TaxID=1433469 RepID=A0A9N9B8D1_9GLOM|nr:2027_t:CDS:2 [Cetraspora pellucida]
MKEPIGTPNGQDSFYGCGTFQKDYLNQHIKINGHINVMKAYYQPANQIDLFTGFTTQADYNKLEIISKMRCVYLCAQKHFPIFAYSDIINLMNLNLKNQTELVYDSEVQTLTPPFFGPKKKKLVTDFSENSSNYAEYTNSVSETTFLHAIATVIEESVLEETRKSSAWTKMLDPSKLLHFGSDGDSKMIEVRNGVATKLKKLNPFMSNCHCIAHRLALAEKDSAKDVPYFLDYEITIKELYAYFANSHTQNEESPELVILQVVSTRWLSLSNSVSNLHQIIFSVIDALQNNVINNFTAKSQQRAQNLLGELDADFILATKFLADILSIISALCKIFQSDYVAFSDIHQELNKTIHFITIEFIGYPDENIEPTLGTHLHDYLLYNAMRIFDFKQVPTTIQQMSSFEEEEIVYLAEYYGIDQIENGWEFIFCTTQFITQYPNLTQIIHLAFIVPVSNGNVECIFSQQNLIKTKLHNQMKLNTLNSHLMIVMNGPSLDKFNLRKHMNYGNVVLEKNSS